MNPSRPQTNSRCAHRSVTDDGRLLCDSIADADREVAPEVCLSCPAVAADCASLRFSLTKEPGAGILVRYGNGRSLVLDQGPATLRLRHAACPITSQAVHSPDECRACSLRRSGVTSAAAHANVLPFPGLRQGQPAGS